MITTAESKETAAVEEESKAIEETKETIEETKVIEEPVEVTESETQTVEAETVETTATENQTEEAETEETKTDERTAYTYTDMDATKYAKSSVNVRSLPDTSGDKLGGLSTNDEVHITGQCNETGWFRFEYNGSVAYVSNSSLDEKVEVASSADTSNNGGNNSGGQSSGKKNWKEEGYQPNVWYDMGSWGFYIEYGTSYTSHNWSSYGGKVANPICPRDYAYEDYCGPLNTGDAWIYYCYDNGEDPNLCAFVKAHK